MRVQIQLETLSDVQNFVAIASAQKGRVHISDGQGLKVSAKSMLGALYALEFENLWCESETDIYHAIKNFVKI
jgi:hypothetical protein